MAFTLMTASYILLDWPAITASPWTPTFLNAVPSFLVLSTLGTVASLSMTFFIAVTPAMLVAPILNWLPADALRLVR